jgi:hypothetical protein
MSYDLMVFAPEVAPKDRKGFMAWYEQQAQWSEGLDYNDPANATENLHNWFLAVIKAFPPMNGPLRSDDLDNAHLSDYTIGRHVIHVGFAWSLAEVAHRTARELAARHDVGFFDASGEGSIFIPENGGLVLLGAPTGDSSKKKSKWKFW